MIEENSMQFFLDRAIPETQILNGINSLLNFQVETLDIPIENSDGFLQVTEYSEGFKLGCLISWPHEVKPNLETTGLGGLLAEKFQCEILCETNDAEWYLVEPGSKTKKVVIRDLEDGIALGT